MSETIVVIGPDKNNGKGGVASVIFNQCSIMNNDIAFQFEFVESHGTKKFTFLRAFYQLTIKCFTKNNDIFWFHASQYYSIFRKCILSIPCLIFRKKIIYQLHSTRIENYLNARLAKILLRLALTIPDKIVVLSPYWLELMKMNFPSITHKFVVLANPVLEAPIHFVKSDFLNDRPYILSMTRLVEGKGVNKVICAMKKLNMDLVIAGQGEDILNLKALCEEYQLENKIHFVGWVKGEEKQKLIAAAQLFVLPSKYDSFGMVFIEAMAQGIPVIAFNIPTVAQVVIHGETGVLIDDDDTNTIIEAIEYSLKNRNELSINAKKHVQKYYSATVYQHKLVQLIYSLKNSS